MIASVRDAYFRILYYKSILHLSQKLDSLYKNFYEIAKTRYKTGETSNLEMLTAQNKVSEIKLRLNEINTTLSGAYLQLQKVLNLNVKISIADSVLYELDVSMSNDSSAIHNTPYISFSEQSVNAAKIDYSLEKSRSLPDFSVAYFHQPVKNNGAYYGYQIGMNVPLWYRPQKNKIKAAKIDMNIAENEYQNHIITYKTLLNQQKQHLLQLENKLKYFADEGLPLANVIIKTSTAAYKGGEIGYIEFVQSIGQALDIRSDYLETLMHRNEVAIIINQILGN